MLKRFAVFLVASIMVLGLLAACGGGGSSDSGSSGSSSGGGNTVNMEMTEMKFTPATINVKPGDKVTVKLTNKGTVKHDFSIDDIGGKKVMQVVDPGKSAEVSFTVPSQAGSWEYYCAEPGHKAAGMHGTVTAK